MVEGGGEDDEEEADGEDLEKVLASMPEIQHGGQMEIRTKERTMMVLRPAIAVG